MISQTAFIVNDYTTTQAAAGRPCAFHEELLVAAAKRGGAAAFDELCQPYTKRLLQVTYRITKNREDSEDAVQDSLLSAFVHIKNFDGRSSFATWLTRIAMNSALMILRKKRNSREVALDNSDSGNPEEPTRVVHEIPDRQPNPEKRCVQRQRDQILRRAIVQLRPKIRQVVELQQLQEESLERTAEMLGISVAATKGRLFHARAALRRSAAVTAIGGRRNVRSVRAPSVA